MSLYVMGDLHLSFGADKSMDVFGGAWNGYVEKLTQGLSLLQPQDTIVLNGDTSWGMTLDEALPDFRFLASLPGRKLIVKGNHDYWWSTASKFHAFCLQHNLSGLELLHNNCYYYEDLALCGTRGWFFEEETDSPHGEKIFRRELIRLEASLKAAGDHPKLCFLHYPPLCRNYICPEILSLLSRYHVKDCWYGHLHGTGHRLARQEIHAGVGYWLCSSDYLGFKPLKIR